MLNFKMLTKLMALCLTVWIIVGCSNSTGSEEKSGDNNDGEDGEVSGEIVATTYGGDWNPTFNQFTELFNQKYPNSNVLLDVGLSADWITKIRAAKEGNPPINVLMSTEIFANQIILEDKAIDFSEEEVPNLKYVPDIFRPSDDSVITMFSPFVIVYRTDEVENPPETWKDLWNEEYRDYTLGLFNIKNSAGTQFLMLTSQLFSGDPHDIDSGLEKTKELRPFTQSTLADEMTNLISSNEIQIAIMEKGLATRLLESNLPIDMVMPEETFMFAQYYQVIENTENLDASFAYINHILDPEIQEIAMEELGYIPTNSEVTVNDDLKLTEEEIDNIITWDWEWVSQNREEMINRWNREFTN